MTALGSDRASRISSSREAAEVDVVVVSYCSRSTLRLCVQPLLRPKLHVIVVDNASTDKSLDAVEDLDITTVAAQHNGGFAAGCNLGWRLGLAPYVLFLNPDARIQGEGIHALVEILEQRPDVGIVAPRIEDDDGTVQWSRRRFPRLRSTYARALYLHRLLPRASWTDEIVRNADAYLRSGPTEWVSGACLLIRRELIELLGGWDEGFFLYGEDIDLCRRANLGGATVWFEAAVVARHRGGASAPRATLLPTLAASQLRYARKHGSPLFSWLQRLGLIFGTVTHLLVPKGGRSARSGRIGALHVLLRGQHRRQPSHERLFSPRSAERS